MWQLSISAAIVVINLLYGIAIKTVYGGYSLVVKSRIVIPLTRVRSPFAAPTLGGNNERNNNSNRHLNKTPGCDIPNV